MASLEGWSSTIELHPQSRTSVAGASEAFAIDPFVTRPPIGADTLSGL
jgi:hypothetical protein